MIIGTANEDIIRQSSFDRTETTRIIDRSNEKQMTSNGADNDIIMSLAVLAELSKSSSENDQIYKRALDSPQRNPSKSAKTSKKSIDMICAICGDRAIGFNYGGLSCSSCKAFFRRNANQNIERIRCLTGRGQCSVAHQIAHKCQKCRLERCLAAGMRRDFIRSSEEVQRRKNCVEENRKATLQRVLASECTESPSTTQFESLPLAEDEIDRLLMDMDKANEEIEDMLFGTLSVEDWITIENVKSSFESRFRLPMAQCSKQIDCTDRVSALISWLEFGNQLALRFIDFFRQINEFEELVLDDRLILIKYNLFPVFPICKCYNYQYENECCSYEFNEETETHRRFFTLFGASNTIRSALVDLVTSLVQVTKQDPIILSLLSIIVLLTPGLSMNDEEPPLSDPLAVNRSQSHYAEVLWNYLVRQSGEIDARRRLTELLTLIFRLQSVTKMLRLTFRDQYWTQNTLDKVAPLMQSVLHIS